MTSTQESDYMKTSLQIPGRRHFRHFNSKKVYEDEIFCRQNILQFFSGEFKHYKYVKFPQTLAAL